METHDQMICNSALVAFGAHNQTQKAIEELAELIAALAQWTTKKTGDDKQRAVLLENVRSEIADAFIVLEQMRELFGAAEIKKHHDQKIDRLADMVAERNGFPR
jgi:hypothetical protein